MFLCMYVCMYVFMYACMYVCNKEDEMASLITCILFSVYPETTCVYSFYMLYNFFYTLHNLTIDICIPCCCIMNVKT